MAPQLSLSNLEPTVCLRRDGSRLRQLVRVTVENPGPPLGAGLTASAAGLTTTADLGQVPSGQSVHDFFLDELSAPTTVEFSLHAAGSLADHRLVPWQPPPHFTVHVVQRSHHDVGYTGLASLVLPEMAGYLDEALDMAAATDDYPQDARFRLTLENVWSLWHFLQTASPTRKARLLELLRSGRFEMTAFFGNMTPELCGSETLARTLYHAARLQREYGLPLLTAEHNDVPGLSWGQCQVLLSAGIRLFCPGLPNYWAWSQALELQGFWDEQILFPHGVPGAFWWEAPSGQRLLLWHSGVGAGGSARGNLPGLPERLAELAAQGCPYTVLRWPSIGGSRDNSPYTLEYAQTIQRWNETWTYPRLICSTNALFYADLAPTLPADLPVFHGELPGQDYPAGATSTALATAANRGNHATLPAAETLATAASHLCAYPYPATDLWTAFEDVIYHDEHTWGHSRNVGPAKIASEAEKAVHAHRAAALGHDVLRKAMAQIADQVALEEEGFYLCVFNPEALPRTGPVRLPLREIDNASSAMHWVPPEEDPEGHGFWQGVALLTRGPAILPPELVAGGFSLLDVATGETVPHQLVDLTAPHDPVPYAPERVGSAVGGPHCGMLDLPHGLGRDLCFLAREVPACGYRTYRLLPGTTGVSPVGASDISPVGGSGVPPVPPLAPSPARGGG